MKKIVLFILGIIFLLSSTIINTYGYNKVDQAMSNFYQKLDKNISDTEKKIQKLEVLQKKIKSIKLKKWDKLSTDSQFMIKQIETNLSNKIHYYEKILDKKEDINLTDLLNDSLIEDDNNYINKNKAPLSKETFISVSGNRIITNLDSSVTLNEYNITPEYTNKGLYDNFIESYLNTSNKRILNNDIIVLTNPSEISKLLNDLNNVNLNNYSSDLKKYNNIAYSFNFPIRKKASQIYLNYNNNAVKIDNYDPFISAGIVGLENITSKRTTYRIIKSPDSKELLIYKDSYSIKADTPNLSEGTFISVSGNRIITNLDSNVTLNEYNITPEYTNKGLYNNFIESYLNTSNKRVLNDDVIVLTDSSEISKLLNDLNNVNLNKYNSDLKQYNNIAYSFNFPIRKKASQIYLNYNNSAIKINNYDPFIRAGIVELENITSKRTTYRIIKSPDRKELLIYKDSYSIKADK